MGQMTMPKPMTLAKPISRLLPFALPTLLSACSAVPLLDIGQARRINPTAAFSAPFADNAMLVIQRDTANICSLASVRITVDGKPAGRLNINEALELYVEAGPHVILAQTAGVCPERSVELKADVVSKETKTYRVSFHFYAELTLDQAASAAASTF